MNDWQNEAPKSAAEIVGTLLGNMSASNQAYALGDMDQASWAEDMRSIDQKLAIFGLRIDRPERFAAKAGRL